jgi:metallo-beta-lactamase family protein
MKNKLKLTFYGGAKTVTGSNFMLENDKKKILIDAGLYQGEKLCENKSCDDFIYDPSSVDTLLVTHSHADHIGRIPKLIHEGFKGEIYSTEETKEISEIMLNDSLKFVLQAATEKGGEPIFTKEDIDKTLSLWKTTPYREAIDLGEGFKVIFRDAGHILGSSIVEVEYNKKKIAFTGDLGNSPTPFLRDNEILKDVDYLVMESVYGDRNHQDVSTRRKMLEEIIKEVIKEKGVLLIPAFSLSRTQVILYELNNLVENSVISPVPIFLDSPLAIKVTEIYKKRQENLKDKAKKLIASGDKIFDFPRLKFTPSVEESKAIESVSNPKIIIAGAGMSNGGRIQHHEKKYLGNKNTTILFVGYQAPGSLGRQIQDGSETVQIFDQEVKILAKRKTISGYSGHKGLDELVEFVEKSSAKLKKVFVVMGEPKASLFLTQRIRDYLDIKAISPEEGETHELDFS